MTIYVLDGKQMTDKQRAHDYLGRALSLPAHYGRNLDALYDCLTELPQNIALILVSADAMRASLGEYGERLARVFRDAARAGGFAFIAPSADARTEVFKTP